VGCNVSLSAAVAPSGATGSRHGEAGTDERLYTDSPVLFTLHVHRNYSDFWRFRMLIADCIASYDG
jgi:hypothetical protein